MDNDIGLAGKCQALGITQAGLELIEKIRGGDPVRRVMSNGHNTSSRYPSKKMRCSIQAESHLELAAVLDFEFQDSCVEFYDQPCRLSISCEGGKVKSVTHVPDFLVLEDEQVYFEELKTVERMEKLIQLKPWRYQYDEINDCYISPAVEKALDEFGIGYRIRTERSFHNIYLANARYLLGYLKNADQYSVDDALLKRIDRVFSEEICITFSVLLNKVPELAVDDALHLIVVGYLHCNLKEDSLQKRDQCRITKSSNAAKLLKVLADDYVHPQFPIGKNISSGDQIAFSGDGDTYRVVSRSIEQCVLINEEGKAVTFQTSELEGIKKNGLLTHTSQKDNGIKEAMMSLSERELESTYARFRLVKRLLDGATYAEVIHDFGVSERTARRYKKKYFQSQQACGDGFVGLIDSVRKRGNREKKISEQDSEVINDFIEEEYLDFKGMKIAQAYHLFLAKHPSIKLSYQTFRRYVHVLETQKIVTRREGYKKGRSARPMMGVMAYSTPVHGSRVFEVAHIDHTQIDLEVFSGFDGKSFRPWLTIMQDAYTRSVLAFALSLQHPSRISCMNILRECVLNHDRLPEVLVVDGGKEFESVYFERLCARYDVEIRSRRCNPRKGAVIERMFGVANSRLFHQMIGNTQQTKDPRGLTKYNNPKNLVIWHMEALENICSEFFYKIYAGKIHPTTGESPSSGVQRSLIADGARLHRRIADHDTFFYESMIPAPQDTRSIQSGRGIKVQGHYFWCSEFKKQKYAGQSVPVKVDIYTPDRVACYIDKHWVFCDRVTISPNNEVSKYTFDINVCLTPGITGLAESQENSAKATAKLISNTEQLLREAQSKENKQLPISNTQSDSDTQSPGTSLGALTDFSLDEFGEL